jgi:hypothetical protein
MWHVLCWILEMEIRMRRWTALVGVLVVGAFLAVVAPPAHATRTPEIKCAYVWAPTIYRLVVSAEYDDNVVGPGVRRWTFFRFMVHGGFLEEDHNNVNIRLKESGRVVFAYNSPDNLEYNRWYGVRPGSPVRTSVWGPEGEHDHRANDVLEVEAVFDRAGIADPRCTATARF